MAFRVVARAGPRVHKTRAESLEAALALLEQRAQELSRTVRAETVDVRVRSYEPADQVAARVEVRGPQRLRPDVRAGVDVRGDGAVIPWIGGEPPPPPPRGQPHPPPPRALPAWAACRSRAPPPRGGGA